MILPQKVLNAWLIFFLIMFIGLLIRGFFVPGKRERLSVFFLIFGSFMWVIPFLILWSPGIGMTERLLSAKFAFIGVSILAASVSVFAITLTKRYEEIKSPFFWGPMLILLSAPVFTFTGNAFANVAVKKDSRILSSPNMKVLNSSKARSMAELILVRV